MLTTQLIEKIQDFVGTKPRSIQEIAQHIDKNWRTADRYIDQIMKEKGTLAVRIFRKNTRGALKIVYWASIEKRNQTVFQENLQKQIFSLKNKQDFSAFDIFQHIKDKDKKAYYKEVKNKEIINEIAIDRLKDFEKILLSAKEQILFFSGNLSFVNYKKDKVNIFKTLDRLIKKGIKMKVICRVDITGKENIKKLLSLNYKHGKEAIEIKHREQPLRATIIDSKFFDIKEIKNPSGKTKELKKKIFIFYTIKDKAWTKWITQIFYKMFNVSIGVEKRLAEINKIF